MSSGLDMCTGLICRLLIIRTELDMRTRLSRCTRLDMRTGLNVFRAGHVHRADMYIAEHAYVQC